jgi:hypothetical protein
MITRLASMAAAAAISFVLTAMMLVTATAFDATYHKRLRDLKLKGLQLQKEIIYLQTRVTVDRVGAGAYECLTGLHRSVEVVTLQIESLSWVALIASLMIDKSDEQKALEVLKLTANGLLGEMEVNREGINNTAVVCSRHGVVTLKTQEVLGLYSEAGSLVRSMPLR